MVRINLIEPKKLADQHLIAEYNEILMLLGYVLKYPETKNIPSEYKLGKGHIKFFKDKLLYLKNRHENIKKEMSNRGFKANMTIDLNKFENNLCNNWEPSKNDIGVIRKRLIQKIDQKPNFYRYYGELKNKDFLVNLISD